MHYFRARREASPLAWLAALSVGLLAGCASLGGEELALHGVELAPVAASSERAGWQLLVEEPRASEPVSGSRIVLRAADGEYAVLPGVRWRESAPMLFQTLLVEAFEACACVAGVARTSAALRGDYLLASELRRFELRDDGDGPPLAMVEASITLINSADGRVAGMRKVAHSVRAERRDAAAGISALGQALNAVVAETLQWTHASATTARPAPP